MSGSDADAVILAGGRATRLGGVSKPDLVVGGQRLLTTAIAAARAAGCERIVVVGPPGLEARGCLHAQEDPPFGGPVAALAAGLDALGGRDDGSRDAAARLLAPQADVLVLACDMPDAVAAVARLSAARRANPDGDGVCLVDASGATQWLAAVYDRRALERALVALGGIEGREDGEDRREPGRASLHGTAMRRLAASLDLAAVADGGTTHDIDTWGDLGRATGPEGTA